MVVKQEQTKEALVSDRVSKLKKRLVESPQKLDTDRFSFLQETYEETEGEPTIIRRAKVLEKVLNNKPLYIDENPFVGSIAKTVAGVYAYPEWRCRWMREELRARGYLGDIVVSEEDREVMKEAVSYWDDKGIFNQAVKTYQQVYGVDVRPALKARLFIDGVSVPLGAGTVDYAKVLNKGIKGIIAEVEEKMQGFSLSSLGSMRKWNFYQAALITLRALINLAHRYAKLAREMAEKESAPTRRQELLEIAEVCEWVPENPPRSFREALQCYFFTHLCVEIEQSGCGSSPGRMGHYLYPFYKRDKDSGKIDEEGAIELFEYLFIKHQEINYYMSDEQFLLLSGHTGQTVTIGGLTPNGEDATTELDYLILETQRRIKSLQPTLALFYHDKLADDFLVKAIDVIRSGLGQPQFMNNDVVVQRLMNRFPSATVQEARDCVNYGCVGTAIAGKTAWLLNEAAEINITKSVELVLNNGKDPMTGAQIGPKTGELNQLKTYDDLFEAFKKQLQHAIDMARKFAAICGVLTAENLPVPFRSVLREGCIESGEDEFSGGSKYGQHLAISVAAIDAANSLAAIKKLVYDEKRLTLEELNKVLLADFEAHEEIQRMCLDAPKHGNGDDYVEEIVRSVFNLELELFEQGGPDYLGNHCALDAYSLTIHNAMGYNIGALPSGRKAKTPLTDGSVSATPGTDKEGPTALAIDAAKALDTVRFASNHLNMKFHPDSLAGTSGARNLLALIKTYMDLGGSHIQFNCVGCNTLCDAQLHPEQHQDLVVRVAGFSAYFTRLDKGVQDEIIKRTELSFT